MTEQSVGRIRYTLQRSTRDMKLWSAMFVRILKWHVKRKRIEKYFEPNEFWVISFRFSSKRSVFLIINYLQFSTKFIDKCFKIPSHFSMSEWNIELFIILILLQVVFMLEYSSTSCRFLTFLRLWLLPWTGRKSRVFLFLESFQHSSEI